MSWAHHSLQAPTPNSSWSLAEDGNHLSQLLMVPGGIWVHRGLRTTDSIPAPAVFTLRNTDWDRVLPSLSGVSEA